MFWKMSSCCSHQAQLWGVDTSLSCAHQSSCPRLGSWGEYACVFIALTSVVFRQITMKKSPDNSPKIKMCKATGEWEGCGTHRVCCHAASGLGRTEASGVIDRQVVLDQELKGYLLRLSEGTFKMRHRVLYQKGHSEEYECHKVKHI